MTEQPQMNGPSDPGRYIDSIDPEDPEYIRQMRRPAEIKEDVKQMESRKRVSLILSSPAFREELEHIVNEQIRSGPHPASLLALQQISELVLPQSKISQGSLFTNSTIIPVADIRGVDSLNYSKGEKLIRCKLGSTFRLVDLMGWAYGLNSHITTRINQSHEHFLVQPCGMMYHEVTAASLLKVDMQGEVLDPGCSNLTINKDGFSLHAAIHAARPDIKTIIHLQAPAAASVSAMKCGLLPLCREAMIVGDVSYFDYAGSLTEQEDKDHLVRALGPMNKVLVLRNNGIVACGETIDEAFFFARHTMAAVEAQIKTMPIGLENISLPSEEIRNKVHNEAMTAHLKMSGEEGEERRRKWRRGEAEFEALMRHLDNMGFRTGYLYREPLMRTEPRRERANADVEVPPTSSSFSYYYDDDPSKTPMKAHMEMQKKHFKTDWLTTPNAYRREEIEETGTPNPKKITKWVGDPDEPHGSPIKLESPHQFAPQGANPKELSQKHKSIRKDYYEDKVTAGPQSRILEGMTWEEAQRIKDGHVSGTADSVIVVGAASKGIIQRDHQHNQVVYKTYYAANPFDNMTEGEMEKYKAEVEGRGDTVEEVLEPGPDGKLISTQERMIQVQRQHTDEVAQQVVPQQPDVQETCIDDEVLVDPPSPQRAAPPSPESPMEFKRTQSARYPPQRSPELVQELEQNFARSRSERKPKQKKTASGSAVNGDQPVSSPAKSSSSGDFERSSKEGSPTKEVPQSQESPSKSEKKKKKKFRMPSFSKKKDKKEKE